MRFWWAILFFLLACHRQADLSRPPDIRYGEDVCSRCHMIINEERYAAARVFSDGQTFLFDDIGELLAFRDVPNSPQQVWFHDYETAQWVTAESAYFVKSPDLKTPMGNRIVAVASSTAANALAQRVNGKVFRFAELNQGDQKP